MNTLTKIVSVSAIASLAVWGVMTLSTNAQDEAVTTADRAAIEKIVEEYIANNPQKIVDALNNFQKMEQDRVEAEAKAALVTHSAYFHENKDLPSVGPDDAKATIVEFFDYNCGYCKRAFTDLTKLLEEYKTDLRVVFVEMPILSPASEVASRMALALDKQDKYFEFHKAAMSATGSLDEARLEQFAKDIGADVEKMKADMKDPSVDKQIKENREKAAALGVRGTPGFIIGDELVRGAVGYEAMKEYIDTASK